MQIISGYSFTINVLMSTFFDIESLTNAICWFLQAIYKGDNKSSVFAPWLKSTPRCERNSTSFSFFSIQPTQSKRSPTKIIKDENLINIFKMCFVYSQLPAQIGFFTKFSKFKISLTNKFLTFKNSARLGCYQ